MVGNPVTQKILADLNDPSLESFIADWDDLEALVIRVYRGGKANRADRREFRQLRNRLQKSYPKYHSVLDGLWPQSRIGHDPITFNPFLALIEIKRADDFLNNWPAMQTLPAIRETLNGWLVDQLSAKDS